MDTQSLAQAADAYYHGWVRAITGHDAPPRGLPTSYQRYIRELYGPTRRDWFPVLNGLLLASVIALVAVLGLLAVTA